MDNPLPLNRTALWEVIENFARVLGADELEDAAPAGLQDAIVSVESVIGTFESRVLAYIKFLTDENTDLRRRLKEKDEVLRDIGRASFVFKNTAHGDVLLIPGDLDLRVKEGLNK